MAEAGKSLLVAEDVDGEALAMLVVASSKRLKVAAVNAWRGSPQGNAAEHRGPRGTAVMDELGIDLEKLEVKDLGKAKKVSIEKDATTLIEGAASPRTSRSSNRSKPGRRHQQRL